jgi:hypothetical protein
LADLLFRLFDEFAVRYARGEHPDPLPYLEQAGERQDELATMLDAFLQWAPVPAPSEAAVRLMEAWLVGEPPLRELRVQRGVRVEDVVEALASQLDVDVTLRGKLRRYFQRLERGALNVDCVDLRVYDVMAAVLRSSRATLLSWARAPQSEGPTAAPAYRADREPTVAPAIAIAEQEDWDAVDELFLGRRE